MNYVRGYVSDIQVLREGERFVVGNIQLSTPVKHDHGNAERYGINFHGSGHTISYITDTRYFPELSRYYQGDVLIISVVRLEPGPYRHLCVADARRIIEEVRPKAAILTHFGITMVKVKPWEVADCLAQETGLNVIAARDGMTFDLDRLD